MESSSQFVDDLTKVMLNIPILNGRIQNEGVHSLDAEFGIEDYADSVKRLGITDDSISFHQIINRFTEFLINDESGFSLINYLNVRNVSAGYPVEYLLFDYCLAALEGDLLDAKFYLTHAFRIIGFSQPFYLLLSVIVYNSLVHDEDIRKFLTLFAMSIEPMSSSSHVESFGTEYLKRYAIYKKEIKQLKQ